MSVSNPRKSAEYFRPPSILANSIRNTQLGMLAAVLDYLLEGVQAAAMEDRHV